MSADKKKQGVGIEVASILSGKTLKGLIELRVEDFDAKVVITTQMTLDKAREVRGFFDGAIEASITDELIVKFLMDKIGLNVDAATAALMDFREMRQGTRRTAWPH